MIPNEMQRYEMGASFDGGVNSYPEPIGVWVRYSDAMQVISTLTARIAELEEQAESLKDSRTAYANILRGSINLSKLDAMHYLGITAIENWRTLFGWDDETNTFDMSGMIPRPTVEVETEGGTWWYPMLNGINMCACDSEQNAERIASQYRTALGTAGGNHD